MVFEKDFSLSFETNDAANFGANLSGTSPRSDGVSP
jgi:hypothetical protein